MKISGFGKLTASQTIVFTGLTGFVLVGLIAPAVYATEDGQFPVFPTVIEDSSIVVSPVVKTKTAPVKDRKVEKKDNFVTNELGVFSPWGTVKQTFTNRARAGEEGVVFALTSLDAKPSGRGDLRYQISYANATDETLRNVSVQVFLPKEFRYLDSDFRPSSKNKGVVVFELDKVAAGEEGAIQLETRLKKKKAKEVVLSATMAYEDINGGKHTVTAATNNAFNGSNSGLTASALDGFGGVMVWLFMIILLVALAFVGYQYFILQASGRRA
ncbi:MAG: hypothetical protein Q8P66_02555 [Candidatus Colwellbacteria bacterium]|nr:hypothetical protein [Candidatus Colwellbacteria bacterium]